MGEPGSNFIRPLGDAQVRVTDEGVIQFAPESCIDFLGEMHNLVLPKIPNCPDVLDCTFLL